MKTFGKMLACLFSAILLGTLLMILVYMLPVDNMRSNVKLVMNYLLKEGIRPSWAAFEHKRSPKDLGNANMSEQLSKLRPFTKADNFTDAIMLSKATYEGTDPVHDAMLNPSLQYKLDTEYADPVANLGKIINDEPHEQAQLSIYARDWHGYLVYMKPLLMTIGFSCMRMLNLLLQFLMFTIIITKITGTIGAAYAMAFALSVLVIDPISTVVSFQYAHVYYVVQLIMIIMLYRNKSLRENNRYCFLFMASGILTAYIDFLTYPFASLGLPTVLYLLLNDNMALAKKIKDMVILGLSWSLGYAGMWSGKWLVSWILTGYNTFADAFGAAANRTIANVRGVNLQWLLSHLLASKIVLLTMIFICILIVAVILEMYISVRKNRTSLGEILPLCLASLYPFVWYAVLKNHSIEHHWMTHKLLSVSVFALACMFIKCSGYKNHNRHG